MDNVGDVFIAIGFGQYIRVVTPAGLIYTVAGIGKPTNSGDGGPATAGALYMNAILVDAFGDLFIAEAGGTPGIREITPDGIINTIAGRGPCCNGYSGDGGPATDGRFSLTSGVAVDRMGNLYVADTYNNVVRLLQVK